MVVERFDDDADRGVHDDVNVAGDDGEHLPDLLGDDGRQLLGSLGEVEGAAAFFGDAAEEEFVEAFAEAEGAGRHPAVAQLARMTGQFDDVDDTVVGLAVGEHEAAAERIGGQAAAHLGATGQPATTKVGAAARCDRQQTRLGQRLRRWGCRGGGEDDVDDFVKADDTQVVAVVEGVDRFTRGAESEGHLVGAHRARAIDDQAQRHRRARGGFVAAGSGVLDGQQPHIGRFAQQRSIRANNEGHGFLRVGSQGFSGRALAVATSGFIQNAQRCFDDALDAAVVVARLRPPHVQFEIGAERDALPWTAHGDDVHGRRRRCRP